MPSPSCTKCYDSHTKNKNVAIVKVSVFPDCPNWSNMVHVTTRCGTVPIIKGHTHSEDSSGPVPIIKGHTWFLWTLSTTFTYLKGPIVRTALGPIPIIKGHSHSSGPVPIIKGHSHSEDSSEPVPIIKGDSHSEDSFRPTPILTGQGHRWASP